MSRPRDVAPIANPGKWLLLFLLLQVAVHFASVAAIVVYNHPRPPTIEPLPRVTGDSVSWEFVWLDLARYFGSEDLAADVLRILLLVAGLGLILLVAAALGTLNRVAWQRRTRELDPTTASGRLLQAEVDRAFAGFGMANPRIRVLPDLFRLNAHVLPGLRRNVLVVTSGLQVSVAQRRPMAAFILTHEAAHVLNRDVLFFYASRFLVLALIVVCVLPVGILAVTESFAWIHSPSEQEQFSSPGVVVYYLWLLFRIGIFAAGVGGFHLYLTAQREVAADEVARRRLGSGAFQAWAASGSFAAPQSGMASYHPSWKVRWSRAKSRFRLVLAAYGAFFGCGVLVCSILRWGLGLGPMVSAFLTYFFTFMADRLATDGPQLLLGVFLPYAGFIGIEGMEFGVIGIVLWTSLCLQTTVAVPGRESRRARLRRSLANALWATVGWLVADSVLSTDARGLVAPAFDNVDLRFGLSLGLAVFLCCLLLDRASQRIAPFRPGRIRLVVGTAVLSVGIGAAIASTSLLGILGAFVFSGFGFDEKALEEAANLSSAFGVPDALSDHPMLYSCALLIGFILASGLWLLLIQIGLSFLGRHARTPPGSPGLPPRLPT